MHTKEIRLVQELQITWLLFFQYLLLSKSTAQPNLKKKQTQEYSRLPDQ